MTDPAFTSFVLGYHGCEQALAEDVFAGKQTLDPSSNDYDWLADGIYFWEHNAQRAWEFAAERSRRPDPSGQQITTPAVVGAVIDLRLCLNLLDSNFIGMVRGAYDQLVEDLAAADAPVPTNTIGPDRLKRDLDCAVIRMLHAVREAEKLEPFDTVRAVFTEGGSLYDGAGFAAKSHIQLCVRNLACIRGYFRPLDVDGLPLWFS